MAGKKEGSGKRMLFNKHKKKLIAGVVLLLIAVIIYSFLDDFKNRVGE